MKKHALLAGITVLAAVLAIGAIACGDDNGAGNGGEEPTSTAEQVETPPSDTPAADAVAHTDDAVAGGASDTVTFAVPSGTSKLYYWCDVSGHEELGMWGEIPVQAAAGDGDDDGEGDGNGSPVPVYVALGAILCAVVLFRRKS